MRAGRNTSSQRIYPDGRAFVLVLFLSGQGEARLREDASARGAIERRVADDSFDLRDGARPLDQREHGFRRVPAPPAGRDDGVADSYDARCDETAADLADDHVVLGAVQEERPQWPRLAGVLADARGEFGRVVRRDAHVVGQSTFAQGHGGGGADVAEDDAHRSASLAGPVTASRVG